MSKAGLANIQLKRRTRR